MADTNQPLPKQLSPIVCTGCSLVCDDILLNREGQNITFDNVCSKGEQHLRHRRNSAANVFEIDGQSFDASKSGSAFESAFEAALANAATKAAAILSNARQPLVAGIEHLGTATQQMAVGVAMRAGAIVDSELDNGGRSSLFSLQRVGRSTATLGEVRKRADLVVFWFCDPSDSHPRLVERFCSGPGQEIISINGDVKTAPDVAQVCEMLLRGITVIADQIPVGVELSECQSLVEKLKSKNYAAFFFDPQKFDPCFDPAIDALSSLISQLNSKTRAVVLPLRNGANEHSAENVLAWSTGFAAAVSTSRNNRSHFLEYSAAQVLKNKECDAALLFAGSHDSAKWIAKQTSGLPTIVVSESVHALENKRRGGGNESLQLTGDLLAGKNDWCRMDDVLIPLGQDRSHQQSATSWVYRFLQLTREQLAQRIQ